MSAASNAARASGFDVFGGASSASPVALAAADAGVPASSCAASGVRPRTSVRSITTPAPATTASTAAPIAASFQRARSPAGGGVFAGERGGAGSVLLVSMTSIVAMLLREAVMNDSSAATTYSIEAKRSAGAFERVFRIVASTSEGRSGASFDGGSGDVDKIASKRFSPVASPFHGSSPVSSS